MPPNTLLTMTVVAVAVAIAGSSDAKQVSSSNATATTTAWPLSTNHSNGTVPNWIGPHVGKAHFPGCYRQTIWATNATDCPDDYAHDGVATCWSVCPLEYPVKCGMECIAQGLDCGMQITRMVGAVATIPLHLATGDVFGKLTKMQKAGAKAAQFGLMVQGALEQVKVTIDDLKTAFPHATRAQLQQKLYNSSRLAQDLPLLALAGAVNASYASSANASVSDNWR